MIRLILYMLLMLSPFWIMAIYGLIDNVFLEKHKTYLKYQNEKIEYTCYNNEDKALLPFSFHSKRVSEFPTISFNKFKDFYNLNPDSWTLCACRVYKNANDALSFTFTYPEWKKYVKFKNQLDKRAKEEAEQRAKEELIKNQNKITCRILEEVQKDINGVRAESQKNISDAMDLIKNMKL